MGRPFAPPHPLPDTDRIKMLITYQPETGEVRWNPREASTFFGSEFERQKHANRWNAIYAGKPAGGSRSDRYHLMTIDGVHHLTHRVIWKYMTGEDPIHIDHIDGVKGNNVFANLRNVTHAVNMKNKSLYANSSTGVTGVEYHKRDKVWRAKIVFEGKQIQLGSFKTKEEAVACRIGAQALADYHPNHGREAVN